MLTFANPLLLWGLLLVGAPVLIHLINLLRHRRVPWAAMEFLLASQKKNSSWIKLKEFLLLLLRALAVAAVALIVAQPRVWDELGRFFGGGKTQHIVLLDDSFSMADRWGDTSAFDEAKHVIERLGESLANEPLAQTFTLLRFSRAGRGMDGSPPDLLKTQITTDFGRQLKDLLRPMRPSQLAAAPGPALDAIEQLLGEAKDEDRVVYLVSDFRANQWDSPGELTATLARLDKARVHLRLINCVDAAHPNLGITALEPAGGAQAAGVPLYLDVTVKNFGGDKAEDVSVLLQEDGQGRPALAIDELLPGESETRRFAVFFPTAGEHVVAASLGGDTLATDNLRFTLLDLPVSVPVLLIDGAADSLNARYLAAALSPGGAVKTGLDPQIETISYLNQNKPLDKFSAVFLLDIERLDAAAIEALENYVRKGGGLGFFMGDRCRASFYNEKLYRDGEGVFPLPLVAKTQLLVDRLERGADFEITDHPIFKVFGGERNSYLKAVAIDWYFSAPKQWTPPADSTTKVIARLRNGAPLAVERQFGDGRVVAILTTAAPQWNNWSRNPSFVVAALEMQASLAAHPTLDANRAVGTPIELELDPGRYQPQVRLMAPADHAAQPSEGRQPPGPAADSTGASAPSGGVATDPSTLVASAAPAEGETNLRASFPAATTSGIYELQLTTTDSQPEIRHLAFNVDAAEGDLSTVGGAELAERLKGVRYEYAQADAFQPAAHDLAGSNLSQWILYLLVALLLGEQALAYSASYHPAKELAR
ncbi:MAG TPA: BatA domain-containing protein [Pirellulales bacterium]|nr:BatA domain-containing protein [Pirellulales bacterium]